MTWLILDYFAFLEIVMVLSFWDAENDFLYHVQDNFGKLHDRSKETPKSMKQITRLFPNKVAIQLPQVNTLLRFLFVWVHLFFFISFSYALKK